MKTVNQPNNLNKALGEPISRETALQRIKNDSVAYSQFLEFPTEHQEILLSFIQGNRGLPIVYDPFFKKIFNPSESPERLERFLSSLMDQQIHIIDIIPREGTQMSERGSFIIMDVLVQTENGSYINVEMQKHGYKFTGERSTCYMSDLVMRQYNKVKSEKGKKFTFKDMKPVYLIVLMENSSQNFKSVSPEYIHHVHYTCDTKAEINFLANYTYVSLDTFHSVRQNIGSYLDAWFTFLSSDEPQDIINLITAYPEFEEYYHDITIFRTKPKELINMYSEVLAQIDKNTERYMIDEMKQEVEELKLETAELKQETAELKQEAAELKQEAEELKQEAAELKQEAVEFKQKATELKQEAAEFKLESEKLRLELVENARNLFINGVPFEIVCNSIKALSEETLKEIYDSVIENQTK